MSDLDKYAFNIQFKSLAKRSAEQLRSCEHVAPYPNRKSESYVIRHESF